MTPKKRDLVPFFPFWTPLFFVLFHTEDAVILHMLNAEQMELLPVKEEFPQVFFVRAERESV